MKIDEFGVQACKNNNVDCLICSNNEKILDPVQKDFRDKLLKGRREIR